ncbi:MAG: hypothetical protein AABX94_03695 [Nanoarchaeota archaeon]
MTNEEKTEKMKSLLDLIANSGPSDSERVQIDEIARQLGRSELSKAYFSISGKIIKLQHLERCIEASIIRLYGGESGPNPIIPCPSY